MPLGYFQFDNLLKNRVRFFILSWVDLAPLNYKLMEKHHLDSVTTRIDEIGDFVALKSRIQEMGLEAAAPILLIDENGVRSKDWAAQLEAEGFLNVYWALGGLTELVNERQP